MWSVPKKKFPPLKNGRKNLMLFHKGNKKRKKLKIVFLVSVYLILNRKY